MIGVVVGLPMIGVMMGMGGRVMGMGGRVMGPLGLLGVLGEGGVMGVMGEGGVLGVLGEGGVLQGPQAKAMGVEQKNSMRRRRAERLEEFMAVKLLVVFN